MHGGHGQKSRWRISHSYRPLSEEAVWMPESAWTVDSFTMSWSARLCRNGRGRQSMRQEETGVERGHAEIRNCRLLLADQRRRFTSW
jgi:hypothetical protein